MHTLKPAVRNINERVGKSGQWVPTRSPLPIQSNKRPELGAFPQLRAEFNSGLATDRGAWTHQMAAKVSLLRSHFALVAKGICSRCFHILASLKFNPKRSIVFEAQHSFIAKQQCKVFSLSDNNMGAKEIIAGIMPTPLRFSGSTHDADHAGNHIT